MKPKFLTIGSQYGRLTVIDHAGVVNHRSTVLCRCECGTVTFVKTEALRKGTYSCGCFRDEKAVEMGKKYGPLNRKSFFKDS